MPHPFRACVIGVMLLAPMAAGAEPLEDPASDSAVGIGPARAEDAAVPAKETATPAPVPTPTPLPFAESVEVTATRLPDETTPSRRRLVLEREEIAQLPVNTLPELVEYLAGTGIARRGAHGVQADAQLRGGTFEQVAVLVDGARVNDPQTGHFHMELPLPVDAIERIEVLLGPGAAVHGAGAFGGVVSITTAPPSRPSLTLSGGSFNLFEARGATPLGKGFWVAGQHAASDGHAKDTDFRTDRFAGGYSRRSVGTSVDATLGAQASDFGAWGFYSSRYPNQYEETDTLLATFAVRHRIGSRELAFRSMARQHEDHYILERDRPAFYENFHTTRSGLAQVSLRGLDRGFDWAAGVEGEVQSLDSARLGDHDRSDVAVFGEATKSVGSFRFGLQGRADRTSSIGWQFSPGLGAEATLGGSRIAFHHGRTFRLPSFTDLYYTSPTTVGNPNLSTERATSDEIVVRIPVGRVFVDGAGFFRRSTELIDFVLADDGIYRAQNSARADTRGLEAGLSLGKVGRLRQARLSLAWLSTDVDVDPARSRYALAHPRFEAALTASGRLPLALELSGVVRARTPATGATYALVDLRLARALPRGLALEAGVTNLFDEMYEEIPGVPMPGRWLSVGLRWSPVAR